MRDALPTGTRQTNGCDSEESWQAGVTTGDLPSREKSGRDVGKLTGMVGQRDSALQRRWHSVNYTGAILQYAADNSPDDSEFDAISFRSVVIVRVQQNLVGMRETLKSAQGRDIPHEELEPGDRRRKEL